MKKEKIAQLPVINAYIQTVNGLSFDLILATIPEPATCTLALIGL